MDPYLVLLRTGFAVPRTVTSRAVRSYRTLSPLPFQRRSAWNGGLLSVALSVGFHPPGVTWRSALRSPDFPPPDALLTVGTVIKAIPAATAWLTQAAE
jgi:hypothetical protein